MTAIESEGRRAELLKRIGSSFGTEPRIAEDGTAWISVPAGDLGKYLALARDDGFDHCSAISVTDWPEEEAFELTYHLWSYAGRVLLTVKSRIDRRKATVDSAVPLWGPSAGIHERELHELFGVRFSGNPDLAPLFLESWDGPPPFRKDFDWRAYVRETFYEEDDPREQSYWD